MILAIISGINILKFNDYKRMYKVEQLGKADFRIKSKQEQSQILKEVSHKQIEIDSKFESNKKGYAFFNELFMNRHKKIVGKAISLETIIILAIIIIIIGLLIMMPESKFGEGVNRFLLRSLPYITAIMFVLNRSPIITQSMYMNCDHSMLTYKFYRTPNVILGLFKERLKTLIFVNLIPAGILAMVAPLILYLSGGTDNSLNYLILFVSIISASIFFSTHYLVIYYLLQPYTKDSEIAGGSYKVVQTITMMVIYMFWQIKMDTTIFGLAMIAFCISYLFIAMVLVYKKAPKTFKIRN